MKPTLLLLFVALCGISHATNCHPNTSCDCPPEFDCGSSPHPAPASIMGDHLHRQGQWMLSLRYMFMDMDGMYGGSGSVSPSDVHAANYVVSPTRMTMDMQMLGAMLAPSDDLTLMVMLPYIQNEMDHVIQGGTPLVGLNGGSTTFTTNMEGLGDLKLSALMRWVDKDRHRLHVGLGVSLPTGSISETDIVPGPGGRLSRQLPAAMQAGSGTFDLLPSLTYTYRADAWSAGVQARGVFRTHENHHDYRLGHRAELDAWVATQPQSWLSLNTGLGFRWEGELHGTQSGVSQNPPFAPARRTVPTAFGENYGGMRLDGILGINFHLPDSCPCYGQRLGLDLRLPMWQDVNGYRLGQDLTVTLGWQASF